MSTAPQLVPEGTVTSPQGFLAAGVRAGLKQQGLDVALILSDCPATAAGMLTTNKFQAAPILVSRQRLATCAPVRAIVASSGNANACTGDQGIRDAERMCQLAADEVGVSAQEVLVASTGIIGHPLPMDKVEVGIRTAAAALSRAGGAAAAEAVMTTDTVPKSCAVRCQLGGSDVMVGGLAKGAGMIAPNMATMFCFLTTDAAVEHLALQSLLAGSVERSFNSITVDGDTSTNDCVFALANGRAGNPAVQCDTEDYHTLAEAFAYVTRELALWLVRDGEGATRLVEIAVEDAAIEADAKQVALTVANSLLVKTALFGGDPNWGRLAAAAGRAGVDFPAEKLRLWIGDTLLFENGCPAEFDLAAAESTVRQETVTIRLSLGAGDARWTAWTCDLSYKYVEINAEYHT